jgi:hypothetical protein
VEVTATTGSATLNDGAGIQLDGGAQARLERVRLIGNRQGLVSDGVVTKVVASHLSVSNGSSTYSSGEAYGQGPRDGVGLGAVEVKGATLLIEDSRISDNVGIGLIARDRARLHARRVVTSGTRPLPAGPHSTNWGGINIYLKNAEAELEDLDSGGTQLAISLWESKVKATGLYVHDAALGISVSSDEEPGALYDCLGSVRYERVENPLSFGRPGGSLPVPRAEDTTVRCLLDPKGPGCQSRRGAYLPCVRVPWE